MPTTPSPLPPPDLLPRTSLPRRPEADARAILASIDPALAGATVTDVGEGWDNVAYAVGGRLLLRVSKKARVATRRVDVERDAALLAFAERNSSLPTNRVVGALPDEGALLLTLVPGITADVRRPEDVTAFAATMAAFLTRLHTVPAVEAASVVQPDDTLESWFAETREGWAAATPRVDEDLRARIEAFLASPLPGEPRRMAFCHNDLGDEHIVMTEDGHEVAGIIDWSDAVLGDPARDLGLLAFDFGPVVLDLVLDRYGGPVDPGLRQRALWHAAHAGIEGVSYRSAHLPGTLDEAVQRLRTVLREWAA